MSGTILFTFRLAVLARSAGEEKQVQDADFLAGASG
jgi:hypothetical protein